MRVVILILCVIFPSSGFAKNEQHLSVSRTGNLETVFSSGIFKDIRWGILSVSSDDDGNPQRLAVDHRAFPSAFLNATGLGMPMPTVLAKASRASSSTEAFSM